MARCRRPQTVMLVGHVEHYSEKGLAGWAFDDERPDEPAYVDVFFDGTLFARLAACLPRVDGQQGGFRLILPPEMWRHRRRILVDVRFAATGAPLANTPRYLASRGAAKRILVMIPAGVRYNHDCVKARPAPLGEHITTYTNTGDWLVCDSSLKLLSFAEVEPVNVWAATDNDIARFNAEFDYAFLRGSNYIHPGFDWRDVEALLDRLKIPVIGFAVGAQAPRAGRLALPEASVRVWRSFADHAASIGVRGAYSAEVLNGI